MRANPADAHSQRMTDTPARGEVTGPDRRRMAATSDALSAHGALVIDGSAAGRLRCQLRRIASALDIDHDRLPPRMLAIASSPAGCD